MKENKRHGRKSEERHRNNSNSFRHSLSKLKIVLDEGLLQPFNKTWIRWHWYRRFPNAQIDFINRPYKNMDISVGNDTYGDSVRIFGLGYEGYSNLRIGARTHIAKNVTLMVSTKHELGDPSKQVVRYGEKLDIGDDVWIGYGATILPGCRKIGNNSVIGACAVVTHDVEPYTVVAGNPAKVIRKLSKTRN